MTLYAAAYTDKPYKLKNVLKLVVIIRESLFGGEISKISA